MAVFPNVVFLNSIVKQTKDGHKQISKRTWYHEWQGMVWQHNTKQAHYNLNKSLFYPDHQLFFSTIIRSLLVWHLPLILSVGYQQNILLCNLGSIYLLLKFLSTFCLCQSIFLHQICSNEEWKIDNLKFFFFQLTDVLNILFSQIPRLYSWKWSLHF